MDLKEKKIIITGVSSGIGLATTNALIEKGAIIIGWGRNKPDYNHDSFHFIQVDIKNFDEIKNAYNKTIGAVGDDIAILINNAGLGYFKFLEKLSESEIQEMFDVNVIGLLNTCKAVLPNMRKQKHGHIINISSIAGLTGIPEATAYCGTKFAVRGISEALFAEVRKYNIKVSCIYPGSVNTNFFKNYEGIEANDTMLNPLDVAHHITHILELPDNFITMNSEIRPMNPDYKGIK